MPNATLDTTRKRTEYPHAVVDCILGARGTTHKSVTLRLTTKTSEKKKEQLTRTLLIANSTRIQAKTTVSGLHRRATSRIPDVLATITKFGDVVRRTVLRAAVSDSPSAFSAAGRDVEGFGRRGNAADHAGHAGGVEAVEAVDAAAAAS